MDIDKEILLIQLVEAHPNLYNKYDKTFGDYSSREQSWTNIAEATGTPAEICQRVWRNLRERFSREMRMLNMVRPEKREESQPVWSLYNHLTFLTPYIHARKKSLYTTSPSGRQIPKVAPPHPPNLLPTGTLQIKTVEEIMNSDPLETSSDKKPRLEFPQIDRLSSIVEKIQDACDSLKNQSADDAFGRYVATSLKAMSKTAKNCARRDILKVIESCENLD